VALAGLTTGTTVLDVGTGTGIVALEAAAAVAPGGRVVGIDVSEAMLRGAGGNPGLRRVGADVRRLPFGDAVFDLVLSNSTLDHFSSLHELDLALRELSSVLGQKAS